MAIRGAYAARLAPRPDRVGAGQGFLLLLCALAAQPLLFPNFISQDGPTHIATGEILRHLLLHDQSRLNETFMLRPYATTNSLVHYVAAGLTALWSIAVSDRIVASVLIALLPFSVWRLAHQYRPANPGLLIALVPFGFSFTLVTGNYNTIAGLSFATLAAATLARHGGRITGRHGALPLALFLLLATWAHPLGLFFACPLIGLMLGVRLLALPWRGLRALWSDIAGLAGPAILAGMPAFGMAAAYIAFYSKAQMENQPLSAAPFLHRLRNLLGLHQLYATLESQIPLCLAMAAVIALSALLAAARRGAAPGKRPEDVLLAMAAMAAAVVLLGPTNISGSDYLVQRLDGLPAIFLVAWAATVGVAEAVRRLQAASLALLAALFVFTNAAGIAQVQGDEAAYLGVINRIRPGSTVVAINAGRIDEKNEDFLHLHHLAADRLSATMLNNWKAHNPGFPIQFVPSRDPYRFFAPFRLDHHDFAAYERATGQAIDCVFIWDRAASLEQDAAAAPLLGQLADGYDLVDREDTPVGYAAVLYARRPGPAVALQ